MVTLWVGSEDDPTEYIVHKKLLCHQSTFFDSAFNGTLKEAHTHVMKLSEDTKETFDVFIHWLYSSHLPKEDSCDESADLGLYYLRLFIIAEKYLIPELQGETYYRIRKYFGTHNFPRKYFVQELFEDSAPTKLHEYIVKLCAHSVVNDRDRDYEEHWQGLLSCNADFGVEVAKDMALRVNNTAYRRHPFDDPAYHSFHESDVEENGRSKRRGDGDWVVEESPSGRKKRRKSGLFKDGTSYSLEACD